MSNLTQRILFALVGIPVVLFLLYWDFYTRTGLMVLLIALAGWEWARMITMRIDGPAMTVATPVVSGMLAVAWILERYIPGVLLLVGAEVTALYIIIGFAKVRIEQLFPWLMLHAAGPLYLGLWGGMCLQLLGTGRGFDSSAAFILVMMSMWISDTFAYVFGRLFGKHKMAPEISPKKTWEGAAGGTLMTVLFVLWLGPWAFSLPVWATVLVGILLSVAGQMGDLFESALKRWAGAKDSSRLFPGHGGVLDRLDSLFFAGPMLAVFLAVFNS